MGERKGKKRWKELDKEIKTGERSQSYRFNLRGGGSWALRKGVKGRGKKRVLGCRTPSTIG